MEMFIFAPILIINDKRNPMNTLEFEAAKAEFARMVLNLESEELFQRVYRCYEEALGEDRLSPCGYTLEEIKRRLYSTEVDALAGRGLSTEEVLKQTEEWA